MQRNLQVIDNSNEFETQLKEMLASNKRVAICCRTKKKAKIYGEMLKQYHAQVISADSPKEIIEQFEDLDKFIEDTKCLVMTSKVTVGTDVQVPFDKVLSSSATIETCFRPRYFWRGN